MARSISFRVSPVEAEYALVSASLRCGEDERPPLLVKRTREDWGARGGDSLMIGQSHFTVGFTERAKSATVLSQQGTTYSYVGAVINLHALLHFELEPSVN